MPKKQKNTPPAPVRRSRRRQAPKNLSPAVSFRNNAPNGKQVAQIRPTAMDPVFRRYVRCILDGIPGNTGVPDGDAAPAVVRNLRAHTTMRPDSTGRLAFALLVSPMGVIHQLEGGAITRPRYGFNAGSESGLVLASSTTSGNDFKPFPLTLTPLNPSNNASTASLRLVNAMHTVSFTGSSLHNGGTVTVDSVDLVSLTPHIIKTYNDGSRTVLLNQAPNTGLATALTANALVGPARNGFSAVHLPVNRDYVHVEPMVSSVGGAIGCDGAAGFTLLTPRLVRVVYTGLDQSATITVDSRVCVQEQIRSSDSSWYPLAKPSELAPPNLLQTFLGKSGSERLYAWGQDRLRSLLVNAARYAVTSATGIPLPIADF